MNDQEYFRAETVDEQIDYLGQARFTQSANSQVVGHIQDFYADDARVIDNVWQRLERHRDAKGYLQHSSLATMEETLMRDTLESMPTRSEQPRAPKKHPHKLTRVIMTGLQVAVLLLVIGGSFVIFNLVGKSRQDGTASSGSTADTYVNAFTGVYRLDSKSGAVRWHYDPNPSHSPEGASSGWAAPVFFQGNIYAGVYNGKDHYLVALDARTGRVRWRKPAWVRAIVVGDNALYVNTQDTGDHVTAQAIKADGSLLWSYSSDTDPCTFYGTIQKVAPKMLYCMESHEFFALDTNNGKQLWKIPASKPDEIYAGSSIVDGRLYICILTGSVSTPGPEHIEAHDATNGKLLWKTQPVQKQLFGFTATNEKVYIGSLEGDLAVLDARTGQQLWTRHTEGALYANPVIDGDTVIVGATALSKDAHPGPLPQATIIAYDTQSGATRWKKPVDDFMGPIDSTPVINGTYYYNGTHTVGSLKVSDGSEARSITISGIFNDFPAMSIVVK
ncbi:hypothetical protein KSD_14520 [Ktedonobacter sp. SOSP1-85]|uniref:PQQ-binding-like beta-propeller repeat protein n=1 Tax=Ktedonobacter sp. SOSP1-85 TaxID=2778367 RepID=UPI00191566F2|nr:PQQ-binding-like beta-propeller repeat protein [Ktedonobacter sp. SOSP1-85]GHO73681.1 hypothetical protein KSD_14520 [Ktedonobacter sp. SOSP1-85]